jgi:uncharacterized protein YuzE
VDAGDRQATAGDVQGDQRDPERYAVLRVEREPEEDSIYIEFTPKLAARTEVLTEQLIIDYDEDGAVTGIEVLDVADGVDLDALPSDLEMQVGRVLEEHGVKLLAH